MVGFNVTLSWGRIEWLPKLSILFAYPLRAPYTYAYSSFGAFPLHGTARYGTVRYGSLLGGFPLGTVPGTWYFFSTTSVEVPSSRTVTKTWRVNSADHWLAWENRHYCVTELATTRPSSIARPARFKSAQPAKDRTQLLFKQTHIFASTTK